MDTQLRTLEREVKNGREDLVPLYGNARAKAGLFWAEEVKDRYLGDALALHNLAVDGTRVNIISGFTAFASRRGECTKTIDDWLTYSTLTSKRNPGQVSMMSPELKSAIALALFDHRDHVAFKEIVQTYAHREFSSQYGTYCYAKFTCNPESPESAPYTVEDISMQRTRRVRTLNSFPLQGYNHRIILAPNQSEESLGTHAQRPPSDLLAILLGNNLRAILALQYFAVRMDNTLPVPSSQKTNPLNTIPPLVIERNWEGRNGFPSTLVYHPGNSVPHTSTRSGFFVEAPDHTPYARCWRFMPADVSFSKKSRRRPAAPSLEVNISNVKPATRCLIGHDSLHPLQKNDHLLSCPDHSSSVVHQKCAKETGIDNCVLLGCDQPYQARKPLEIRVKRRGAP